MGEADKRRAGEDDGAPASALPTTYEQWEATHEFTNDHDAENDLKAAFAAGFAAGQASK